MILYHWALLRLVPLGWILLVAGQSLAIEPIPDKLVVLTFDDSSKSHFTIARPILQKLGFGATFFITEGWDFATNKRDYMSWEEIAQLHRDGFEVGNHTKGHTAVSAKTLDQIAGELRAIAERCRQHGIPVPTSFAYPGNGIHKDALPILKAQGIRFARRGGSPEHPYKEGRGFAYEPGLDHPLLIPTAGDARPAWTIRDLERAVGQARQGRVAVLQYHGVPDTAHDWVTTPKAQFEEQMRFLAANGYKVIALRDLERYVDPTIVPRDPWGVIEDRKKQLEGKAATDNSRRPATDAELRAWLINMAIHRFSPPEMSAAIGLPADAIEKAIVRLGIKSRLPQKQAADAPLMVLPYPGGRHPRIGFLDGAIRPQRETKVSIFAPWPDGGYVVADVPEAIWFEPEKKRELLYLAHTHIPTFWDKQGVQLPASEWILSQDGTLQAERLLPNKVSFGARVQPSKDGVRLRFWIKNGTNEALTGLRAQMCVMLKGLTGFAEQTSENKVLTAPIAACRNREGDRWVITAWESCERAWGNPPCPCLHSDPRLPDVPPGEIRSVRGWLSFYEGKDPSSELARCRKHLSGLED